MRFRSLHKWSNDDHSLDSFIFFGQRLEELLFDYTLDSYKPSALNAPFLCREALSLISDIEQNLIENSNLGHVLSELEWSIKCDKIAKSLLDADISYYILQDDTVNLSEKKIKLEVLSCTLEPFRYLNKCLELLENNIINNNKKLIETYSSKLITTLVNIGVSKAYLYTKVKEFFFIGDEGEISNIKQLKGFFASIYPAKHSFEVIFIVSGLIKEISSSVQAFRTEIVSELTAPFAEFALQNQFTKDESETYVVVKKVKAYDHYAARSAAERTLDNLSDLFTLFYHKKQITWRSETLISQCCQDGPLLVKPVKGAMEKGFDLKPERASKELNFLLKNFSARGSSFQKFNRIADIHGICIANDIPENQLVNLWTSLETIVPSHVGSCKINGIVSAIMPFILSNYINRIIQRFTEDMLLWDKWKTKKILNKVPNSKGFSIYQKAFNMLAIEDNQSIRDELYASLRDFYLLRHRAFQLSETLKSPDIIKELLETHKQKVDWQIRRIYRTRNLIVHSGKSLSYIHTLIENGHDYLDQILFDTVYLSCNEYKIKSLEQAFEVVKVRYQKFERNLSNITKFDANNGNFLLVTRKAQHSATDGQAAAP